MPQQDQTTETTTTTTTTTTTALQSNHNYNHNTTKHQSKMITLHSCDDKKFQITFSEAQVSNLLTNTIEGDDDNNINDNSNDNNNDTEIHLPNVNSETLTHIVKFMKQHNIDPLNPASITPPFQSSNLSDIITQEWYIAFIHSITTMGGTGSAGSAGSTSTDKNDKNDTTNRKLLFDLINAANYMDIQPLLNMGCLVATMMMMGKNSEQIRVMLNIDKMTEEEELKAREDHKWMFS